MKLLKNLLLLATLALFACEQDEVLGSQGWEKAVITGFDGRYCGCCGIYWIEIKGKEYLLHEVPEDFLKSNRPAEVDYPLKVRLKWEALTGGCFMPNTIKALEIEIQ
jgi:hypothetical protein